MSTVSVEEAQAHLTELLSKLAPGEAITLTRNNQPVAQLTALPVEEPHPVFGRGKGRLTVISEDDEHLKDWAEYLP